MTGDLDNLPSSGNDRDVQEAFMRLLVEHAPRLRCFLRSLLPTWEDVEEVAQEASLVAWRKFAEFHPGTSFGGWLLTIGRFEALKYRRRVARSPLVFSEDVWELLADDAANCDSSPRYQHLLEACLQKLNAQHRTLLLRAHTPGAISKKIAVHAGISEQAFYKLIQRLRAGLLKCVSQAMAAEMR